MHSSFIWNDENRLKNFRAHFYNGNFMVYGSHSHHNKILVTIQSEKPIKGTNFPSLFTLRQANYDLTHNFKQMEQSSK